MTSRLGDQNGHAEIAIIFIHGLGGGKETWKDFTKALKQKWIRSTPVDLLYPVYTSEEKKGFLGKTIFRSPDVYRLSNFIENYINEACKEHKYIILVGHSMGGLVSRRYVVDYMDSEKFKITDLLTYATPHKGSILANFLIILIYLIPFLWPLLSMNVLNLVFALAIDTGILLLMYYFLNPQVRQLAIRSRFIRKLNLEWTKRQAYNKINFLTISAGMDWIVKLTSSNHYEDDVTLHEDPGKSHSTILKPVDLNDYSLCKLYNTIGERIDYILDDEINDSDDVESGEDDIPAFY